MSKLIEYKELVRELADMLDRSSLTEIEVEEDDFRIRVARDPAPVTAPQAVHLPASAAPAVPPAAAAPASVSPTEIAAAEPDRDGPDILTSPMVGTAYLASSPESDPFTALGKTVSEGQTVLIIEAMKVMNPIAAHKSGVVKEIFVSDAQPVEFDAPLMRIE